MVELVIPFDTLPNSAKPLSCRSENNGSETTGPYLVAGEGSRHSRGGARRSQRLCQ